MKIIGMQCLILIIKASAFWDIKQQKRALNGIQHKGTTLVRVKISMTLGEKMGD